MRERDCKDPYPSYKVQPLKVFISHSGKDDDITQNIADILGKEKNISPYIAERESIGVPLMAKLRDELIDSDAILVIWTKNAYEKPIGKNVDRNTSSEIMGFETGMAWANHLNTFIIKDTLADITWFYSQLTDYVEIDVDKIRSNKIDKRTLLEIQINKLNFNRCVNPICFAFPKENNAKKNSRNEECVANDGSIHIRSPFDDILYFNFGNHTNRIIRDIRITIEFPALISIEFDEGDSGFSIKREIFWMRKVSPNVVRLAWPVLPSEEYWAPELRLKIPKMKKEIRDSITIAVQGGDYSRRVITIPIFILP